MESFVGIGSPRLTSKSGPPSTRQRKNIRLSFTGGSIVGVTIVAKYDYCDSIDIAGSTIAIPLLLWTTIAILLRYYCLKHLGLFEGENKKYGRTFLCVRVPIFVWKQQKNFSILLKFTYLAEMIGMQQHIHPIAI